MNKLPINRIVAFAGPYIAILSGAVSDWLLVHVHLLELFHTTKTQVAGAITQIAVFGLTAILVWLGQHKWLTGWQQFEQLVAGEAANGPDVPPEDAPAGDYDPETAGEGSEPNLEPADEPVEIASDDEPPPPPVPAARRARPATDNPQA